MDVHLKNLFSRFQEQFGSGPGLGPGSGTCLMKVDGIGPPFIRSLYKAAASLYRTDPWQRLRPGHLFGVKVGKDRDWYGRRQPFPCVQFIGGDGGTLGIHMFRSPDDAKKATGPRETLRVPNVELLRVTYELESVMLAPQKRLMNLLALERSGDDRYPIFDVARCTPSGGLGFRNPTGEELRFACAVMKAVSLVHPLLVHGIQAGPKYPLSASFEPFIETVDVQWPMEMVIKGNDLVPVTISHPPNQGYEEKNRSAAENSEQPPEEGSFC
ncbi:uncharacterized protein LOC127247293 [Andrographis paniculata]|uniref:uncharacterized protein LOC127247293 n=1 Tax=Andrographis paniculata TaxID=175694 RepID=UPI0021E74A62|nr:uncharacterized protein LOC127247293 [Andrographis paniculata]